MCVILLGGGGGVETFLRDFLVKFSAIRFFFGGGGGGDYRAFL